MSRRLKKKSFAFPPDMVAWIINQSTIFGMSANSFVQMKLRMSMESEHGERLRRLETRVAQLEHKLNSGL